MGTGFPAPVFLGIVLILGGVFLFFLGRLRPALRRDADIVYAIIALISGLILIIDFSTLNFGLIFQQVLVVGALIALTWENLVLRGKNPPTRPREMPPRRPRDSYTPPNYRDAESYRDHEYEEAPRRSSRRRRSEVVLDPVDEWEAELPQPPRARMRGESQPTYREWDNDENERETAIITTAPERQEPTPPPRPRRPRPQYPPRRSRPSDSDVELDNSSNFDDDDL
ncbi:MAG: Ycf66 family protein [Gloeomargarita sp. HHBFW_bins_162]